MSRLLPFALVLLSTNAVAGEPLFRLAHDVKTTVGPRIFTDDMRPMFGARLDHAFSERWAASLTAGATSDWGANVDGGTVTVGLDVHPFGGGLTGLYMGPRVTGNFRDQENQVNGKLLWGYNIALEPGLLVGGGFGPGIQTNIDTGESAVVPAGELLLSLAF